MQIENSGSAPLVREFARNDRIPKLLHNLFVLRLIDR